MKISKKLFAGTVLALLSALFIVAAAVHAPSTAPATTKKTTATKKPVAAPVPTKPVLEPKALEILKAASDRLAAAHSMSFTSMVTYESPSRVGVPLAYTTKSDVILSVRTSSALFRLGMVRPLNSITTENI